jgi:murein DD-endopeptidase MepM/ murein hydrolase activator NlpD
MHLSVRKVKAGEVVKKGTIIGLVGETGYASGPHLHLSIKINGISVNPLRFVQLFK